MGMAKKIRSLIPQRDGTVIVPLANARGFALIDEADAALVGQYNWYVSQSNGDNTAYVVAGIHRNGRPFTVGLHRLLIPEGENVDHINGNGLDNRRENLRVATRSQNRRNSRKHKSNTTGFKGVCFVKYGGHGSLLPRPYTATITVNKRKVHLGYFETAEEAARAYDDAARKHYGDFAQPNF